MQRISESGSRVMQGGAQWRRCALRDTMVVDDSVLLDVVAAPPAAADVGGDPAVGQAGLAFDRHCRLFHAVPEAGALEFVMWGRTTQLGVHDDAPHRFEISAAATEVEGVPAGALPQRPLGLACDASDHLYVADPAARAVWLIDTWQQEVARQLLFDAAPIDLASDGDAVFVLLADGSSWQLTPCEAPQRTPWPVVAGAERLAVALSRSGQRDAWVLLRAGHADASLQPLHAGGHSVMQPFCTGLVIEAASSAEIGGVLVLAQRPGAELLRLQIEHVGGDKRLPGLIAPHYDGRGIALAPDRRIAYWTGQGLRHAASARAAYRQSGLVFGFALDSDHDQMRWGRLVVEACVPAGTQLRFWAFSRDEIDFVDAIGAPTPPGVPPVLSQRAWELNRNVAQTLFRDPSHRPLAPLPADGFALYDAPIIAPPGRFLWLVFELVGTRGKSPRIRSARVAYPGHALLSQLPRAFSADAAARDFLFRYLSPIAAMLDEWEGAGAARHRLLDARIAPSAALPWLAGFVGLVLDPCWPAAAQRRMILEAAGLFRSRGTLASLRRMIEILTDSEVIVIEHFRLRGGGVVGNPASVASQAVLGGGYRVGGMIGEAGRAAAPIPGASGADFDDFAHRFTVTVVAALDAAQLGCVRRLIELHKPAHTDFELCSAASGIRAGVGAHVGISSVIGRSAGFEPALVGEAVLGAGHLLGRPALPAGNRR